MCVNLGCVVRLRCRRYGSDSAGGIASKFSSEQRQILRQCATTSTLWYNSRVRPKEEGMDRGRKETNEYLSTNIDNQNNP